MLDRDFLVAASELYSPEMGTEHMGPLLYCLVRSTRPRRVLEVGMGYTSLFILKALQENALDREREQQALVAKTRLFLEALGERPITMEDVLHDAPDERGVSKHKLAWDWLKAAPPLAAPAYYLEDHRPVLHAIDNMSHLGSSAGRVEEVVQRLGLSSLLRIYREDFRGCSGKLDPPGTLLDLVWFDCGVYRDYEDFLAEYWDRVDPNGGLLLLHNTLNGLEFSYVVKDLKLRQASGGIREFELVSLLEPHKLTQGSVTIVRKIAAFKERFSEPAEVIREAHGFLLHGGSSGRGG